MVLRDPGLGVSSHETARSCQGDCRFGPLREDRHWPERGAQHARTLERRTAVAQMLVEHS
jgi:hypothetical protein